MRVRARPQRRAPGVWLCIVTNLRNTTASRSCPSGILLRRHVTLLGNQSISPPSTEFRWARHAHPQGTSFISLLLVMQTGTCRARARRLPAGCATATASSNLCLERCTRVAVRAGTSDRGSLRESQRRSAGCRDRLAPHGTPAPWRGSTAKVYPAQPSTAWQQRSAQHHG
jgi:hypothetical protein